jgi:hypothetical protein
LSDIERKRRSQALDEAAAKISKGQQVPRVAQQYHQALSDQKQMEIDRKEGMKRKREEEVRKMQDEGEKIIHKLD